jgi:hypothetical protein
MKKTKKLSVKKIIVGYGFHIWFLLFLVNVVIFYTTQYHARSQTCFTPAQVQADSRCLYILSKKVYVKGTRNAPHQGHACGTDVTSIIPSFHASSPATYLDPNYVGDICTAPTITPTITPSLTPTSSPTPSPSPSPTPTITPTVIPTKPAGGVPSPACLGAGCITPLPTGNSPTTESTPSPSTQLPGGTNGNGQRRGVADIILALLLAIVQLFLALLGGK